MSYRITHVWCKVENFLSKEPGENAKYEEPSDSMVPFDDFVNAVSQRAAQIEKILDRGNSAAFANAKRKREKKAKEKKELWESMMCPICNEVKCDDFCDNFNLRRNNNDNK